MGTFFIRVHPNSDKAPKPSVIGSEVPLGDIECEGLREGRVDPMEVAAGVTNDPATSAMEGTPKLRVTLLFVVVVSLSIIDIVFAVDSVTAKISSVSSFGDAANFFLNLTSSAFAMFVLR